MKRDCECDICSESELRALKQTLRDANYPIKKAMRFEIEQLMAAELERGTWHRCGCGHLLCEICNGVPT